MDLTYMPGELDYKDEKKGESTVIKREHDSVDDFEHLDPELSPNVHKDFPINLIDTKPANEPGKFSSEEQNLIDPLTKTDGNSPLLKSLESASADNEDALSHLDLNTHNSEIKTKPVKQSNLLDFEIRGEMSSATGNDHFQDDSLNSDFITSEIANNKVKTDTESDLLGLVNKAKGTDNKDLKDLPTHDDFTKPKEDLVSDPDFGFPKSMKESEALSQYDIKSEKKDIEKKDNQVTDDAINVDLDDDLIHEDTKQNSPKHQEADALSTEGEGPFKTDSTVHSVVAPKPEIEKVQDNIKKGPTKDDPYLSDDDLKTYVAVCPSYPESDPSLLESKPDLAKSDSDVPNAEPAAEEDNESWRNYPSEEDIRSHRVVICPPKPPSVSELDDIIGPEDVFKRIGLDAWFTPERLHPRVEALVYWRDPKQSGVVFGSIMAILLSLCYMSLISVVAYASLFALTGTVCFRIYKNILQAVQKTSEGHPFKDFLDLELSLPQDKVREITDLAVGYVNAAIAELRRLFLVEDLIDSIKFGVCLWCLTYVGAIFNGMTLVILAFVALFTVPKIYENNKASIDTYIDMGRSKVAEITTKVKAAMPIGKKETESKDKEQ